MNDSLKIFGIERDQKAPRLWVNTMWVPFEIDTVVIGNIIVSCSYMDRKTMPPLKTQYGDTNRYLLPEVDLKTGDEVAIEIRIPGKDNYNLNTKAIYIGTKQGVKDCAVIAAKDDFSIGVLVSYFKII